ncbi:MAG TPA: malto-oligosyltrehalose synthase [Gemmatimonadaceae bacterium]|nr:malto-oligosyltrehalose synthase [Gemmatimonadaceae bacterium]
MRRLTATYRLQMNAGFTLRHACARVDYFARLGVSHLYCSPVFAARSGSMHGYDVVDPTRINAELGTEDDLRALAEDLHAKDMGLILDIVPNHMGIGAENRYWDDVLTYGERSRYARWFDIDWSANPGERRRLILPILGDELDRVLERGELSVRLRWRDTPRIEYFNHSFPIDPSTLPPELQLAQVDPEETGELANLYSGTAARERLKELLDAQRYELVSFRRASSDVNYRRFFDVADLVGVRVEDPDVFAETHSLVLRLVQEGVADGLRVDHIDGLRDPLGYLTRLRAAVPGETSIFVEKILEQGERLRSSWPVQGTTGYEFLNDLEDIFIDPSGFADIERDYRRWRKLGSTAFRDVARAGKRAMLEGPLHADVERLAALLANLVRAGDKRRSRRELAAAIIELAAAMPVYRTYIDPSQPVDLADRELIEAAARNALAQDGRLAEGIALVVEHLLGAGGSVDEPTRAGFVRRFQQLTGPAAAKGVEDTALYVYVPLLSRNEVGGAPDRPLDDAVARLHDANARRAEHWPVNLLCTTTHDTKRSADVRSRLDVLSEIPQEWERSVRRWRRLNQRHRRVVKGRMAPDTNSEYVLYQTLVALWPPPRPGRRIDDLPDRRWRESAGERLTQYMVKAAREAKTRTSWTDPDSAYESALTEFVGAVLQPADDAPFLIDVARLVSLVALAGAWNALSRLVVHLTSPGTPDLYQGDEFWNCRLVDPDNRRQIDYDARVAAMDAIVGMEDVVTSSAAIDPHDNRVKLFVTARLLELRRRHPDLFAHGAYRPLEVSGRRRDHVFAFARELGSECAVTVATRLTCSIRVTAWSDWWADTAVMLPPELGPRCWRSQLERGDLAAGDSVHVGTAFGKLPMLVAVG